jgi:glycosyltransferase involved in cell wall biosynthesis
MTGPKTDFFRIVDNFAKTAHVSSTPIFAAECTTIPRVTIAIPTYRRAELLREALESALCQQDYEEYDVIVVDNDPDADRGTERVVSSFPRRRLSYYRNSANLGMAGNWNRCFELARGAYVVLLHDDDILFPSFLRECMAILAARKEIGILKPASVLIGSSGNPAPASDRPDRPARIRRAFDVTNLVRFAVGSPTACLFDKNKVIRIGGFNADYHPTHDYVFVVLFSSYFRAYTVNKELAGYRILVNDSLKEETVRHFFHNDYFLLRQLASRYFLPWFLFRLYLGVRFAKAEGMYRKRFNPSFRLDMASYGLRRMGPFVSMLVRYVFRIYVLLWEAIRSCTEACKKLPSDPAT